MLSYFLRPVFNNKLKSAFTIFLWNARLHCYRFMTIFQILILKYSNLKLERTEKLGKNS